MILQRPHIIHRAALAAAFCTIFATPVVATDSQAFDIYQNARFGYTICYPGNLLIPQRESDNSDGRSFLAQDGTELTVWAGYNVLENTLAQEMRDAVSDVLQKGGSVSYKASKQNWFVISGELKGQVYYRKTIGSDDRFTTFHMTYSRELAERYDPVIRLLNKCFHD